MNEFLLARSQMAMSLAFHIVFAALGIGLPLLMSIAEGLYLRTGEPVYLSLSRRWAKGAAILFAVGAVSGTVLSFELGLLWPTFMEKAGAVIGMPFSLEGFAFFTEAIFLGLFLYGWRRLPPLAHWFSGLLVAISGILSGIFVVMTNAWMNSPTGFRVVDGKLTDLDPIAAMLNHASFHEALHMTLAAFLATGFAVAAVHAFYLLKDRTSRFHRGGLAISLTVACVSAPLQLLSGDRSSSAIARLQPVKFAAMEAHYHTQVSAPLLIGGLPNDATLTTDYALRIPAGLSFLVAHNFSAKVVGLEEFPRGDWPNIRIVHWSFDLMVASGMILLSFAFVTGWFWWRHRRIPDSKWFLRGLVAVGPLGFIAIEFGWIVTEVGRQPWIIQGVLRTSEAVTPMRWMAVPFAAFTALYVFLAVAVALLLRRQFRETIAPPPPEANDSPHA